MKRATICILLVMPSVSCHRNPGNPPVEKAAADCIAPGAKLDWTGDAMCSDEQDKQTHMQKKPVQISQSNCQGIHIKHAEDFGLTLVKLSGGPASCPDNPFSSPFPFNSDPQKQKKEYDTGKVPDKNFVGCKYEIYFKPKANPTVCDPHVDITQ